jgi:hypothetical protein
MVKTITSEKRVNPARAAVSGSSTAARYAPPTADRTEPAAGPRGSAFSAAVRLRSVSPCDGPRRGGVRQLRQSHPPRAVIAPTSNVMKASSPSAIHTIRCARACRCQLSRTRENQARAADGEG